MNAIRDDSPTSDPLVLTIDDEAGILRLLKLELVSQGFRVIDASNGEEGLALVEEQRPDVILLDIMMPEMDGLEVLRRIREHMNVPVLMVTAKDSNKDKIYGLELGADDYIVKPFSPEELTARIRSVLRRTTGDPSADRLITVGDVKIDLNRRLVERGGEIVSLTRTEWLLLQHLAMNPGRVILNADLLGKVWGPEYQSDVQYLRVWVSRLRKKLEPDASRPVIILTMQGIGYMLAAESAPSSNPPNAPVAAVAASASNATKLAT